MPSIPAPGSPAAYCIWAKYVTPMNPIPYSIGSNKDLTIIQTNYDDDTDKSSSDAHLSPDGQIIVRRLPKDSDKGPHFSFDVRTSDPSLVVLQTWDEQTRTLKISTPRSSHIMLPGPHCISLEITAWLPEDAELNSLLVQSVSLTLAVLDDVKISVFGGASFISVSGDVHFPNFPKSNPSFEAPGYSFDTRRITVDTTSGSISGLFPLYDLLSLHSISGSVRVGVTAQSIDPTRPAPAELKIKTNSGTINCRLPQLSIGELSYTPPLRDYITHIESVSGTISGAYYQGSHGYFYSMSGGIQGSILPIIGNDLGSVSTLDTITTSGTTSIELLSPIFYNPDSFGSRQPRRPPYIPIHDDDPYLLPPPQAEGSLPNQGSTALIHDSIWQNLKSNHQSTSGKIAVRYPSQWEGTVDASSISGSIALDGKDLYIVRVEKGWGVKQVVAMKGYQGEGKASMAVLTSVSGRLSFSV